MKIFLKILNQFFNVLEVGAYLWGVMIAILVGGFSSMGKGLLMGGAIHIACFVILLPPMFSIILGVRFLINYILKSLYKSYKIKQSAVGFYIISNISKIF